MFPGGSVDPTVTQATCTAGEVTVPTIALATEPAGVTYVADPPGPLSRDGGHAGDGDGDVGRRLEVGHDAHGVDVGRPDDGDVHGDVERGVVYGGDAGGADGDPGGLSEWGVGAADGDVAETDGITYTDDETGPYQPVQDVVTVTATLDDAGVGWPDVLPTGWTEVDSTTATYTVRSCGRVCFPVAPSDPTVTRRRVPPVR